MAHTDRLTAHSSWHNVTLRQFVFFQYLHPHNLFSGLVVGHLPLLSGNIALCIQENLRGSYR